MSIFQCQAFNVIHEPLTLLRLTSAFEKVEETQSFLRTATSGLSSPTAGRARQ